MNASITKFADNTSIMISESTLNESITKTDLVLHQFQKWFAEYELSLNVGKSNIMRLH